MIRIISISIDADIDLGQKPIKKSGVVGRCAFSYFRLSDNPVEDHNFYLAILL